MTFNDLSINPCLIEALKKQNITEPTEIQRKVAKPVFENRDVIACSNTGTGKTLAYLLPVQFYLKTGIFLQVQPY